MQPSGGGEGSPGSSGTAHTPAPSPGTALRLVLSLCALLPAYGQRGARLAHAALDILTDPACSTAIDGGLRALASSQPDGHHQLLLTAGQLRERCHAFLARSDWDQCHGAEAEGTDIIGGLRLVLGRPRGSSCVLCLPAERCWARRVLGVPWENG